MTDLVRRSEQEATGVSPVVSDADLAKVRYVEGELIDDREVKDAEGDRLGHEQIANQLADLARSVQTPANVALYGPWGSGKSGIANLLRANIDAGRGWRRPKIRFARFDAFKFAEAPLRRNFVSAVASELGISDDKFHDDLYRDKAHVSYDLRGAGTRRLLGLALVAILGVCALTFGVAALASWLQGGDYSDALAKNVGPIVGAGFPLAALVSAIIFLINRSLAVDTKTGKVESDEQFERLLMDLVNEAKVDQLVIFVDEIDRCAPSEVVATLDAIRTFLGVPKCIFIVAADQQVLEEALSSDVKQATPADARNPYYSAGSAYLDKVFQYQVSVPPLRSQSIAGFAADLIRDRPGVWAEVDTDYLSSVLVPSHVHSPRRVKHLLNAFVLAYRLAQVRRVEGRLHTEVKARANELARLVCFRVEFPLFARDLIADHRLPEYVLALANGSTEKFEDLFPFITPEMRLLADLYAQCKKDVALTLADDEEPADPTGQDQPEVTVQQRHGAQLLDYLSRTQAIPVPQPDLIFMESAGFTFGLDSVVAEQLERHAQNRNVTALQRTIDPLGEPERSAVVDLLLQQVRATVGLERDNVVESLLVLHADGYVDLTQSADVVLRDILPPINLHPEAVLKASTVAGAWDLARRAQGSASTGLRLTILGLSLLDENANIAADILTNDPTAAIDIDKGAVRGILQAHLEGDSVHEFVQRLHVLPDDAGEALVQFIRTEVGATLRTLLSADQDASGGAAPSQATASHLARVPAASVAQQTPSVAAQDSSAGDAQWKALQTWVTATDQKPRTREALLHLLLAVRPDKSTRTYVLSVLPDLGSVERPSTWQVLLEQAPSVWLKDWPVWLAGVPADVGQHKSMRALLARLTTELFNEVVDHDTSLQVMGQAAAEVRRITGGLSATDRLALGEKAASVLDGHASDDDTAVTRLKQLEAAARLADHGLLDRRRILEPEVIALQATLTDLPAGVLLTAGELADYLARSIPATINGWNDAHEPSALSKVQIRTLILKLDQCEGFADALHMRLQLSARAAALSQEVRMPAPPLQDLLELLTGQGTDIAGLTSEWLRVARPSADDLTTLLEALGPNARTASVLLLVAERRSELPADDQQAFVRGWLASPNKQLPSEAMCQALGIADIEESAAAQVIIDRYQASTANDARRSALALWRYADITTDTVRRRLFDSVLIPQFRLGSQATRTGLDFLPHLAKTQPHGTKGALQSAVEKAVAGDARLRDKAVDVMGRIGYPTERSGLFGLGGRRLRKDEG